MLKIINFDIVDSTQLRAKEYIKNNIIKPNEWLCFCANSQTIGVGTCNRSWLSPPDVNIYITYVHLIPKINDFTLLNIPQVSAMAVIELLQKYGLKATYKWINDVLVSGKKICGILAESEKYNIKNDEYYIVYLGIGLNVNMTELNIKTNKDKQLLNKITSMKLVSGKNYNKQIVLNNLNNNLIKNIKSLNKYGFEKFYIKLNKAFETFEHKKQLLIVNSKTNGYQNIYAKLIGLNKKGHLKVNIENHTKTFVDAKFV